MLKSMTGYGRNKQDISGKVYTIEIKSVNHKYNDIAIKLPRSLNYLEDKIKKQVLNSISRGKIDVFVSFLNYGDITKEIRINKELAKTYVKELKELAEEADIENNIDILKLVNLPEVLTIENKEDAEETWEEVSTCLEGAIVEFTKMRIAEGNRIEEDLLKRLEIIAERVNKISEYSGRLVEEYIVKLEERIKELLKTDVVDQTRLARRSSNIF